MFRALETFFTICSYILIGLEENRVICNRCKTKTRIIDSRRTEDKLSVRRKRICYNCGYEFITYESKVSHKQDRKLQKEYKKIIRLNNPFLKE